MADEVYKVPIGDKMTDISELKVTELKVELKKRGVSTTGTKRDLYEKLKNYLIKNTTSANNSLNNSSLMNNNNLSINTTQSDLETSKVDDSVNVSNRSADKIEVENIEPIREQLPLKRQNEDNIDQLNHKKVKHVQVAEAEPQIIETDKKTEEPVVVMAPVAAPEQLKASSNNNNEMELSINKSRSNSIESRSPTRSVSASTRSPSPSSRSTSRSNSVLNNNNITNADAKVNENGTSTNKVNSPSNGSTKSESVIKEIPMSGDRNRFSRSRSPKSRWHASRTPDLEAVNAAAVAPELTQKDTTEVNDEKKEEAENDMPKVERKRRWFTNNTDPLKNTSRSISISSDTLKTYLPDAKIPKSIDADVLTSEPEATVEGDEAVNNGRKVIKGDQSEEKFVQRQPSRTVIIEENNELIYEDALSSNELNKSMNDTGDSSKKQVDGVIKKDKDIQHQTSQPATEDPERVGDLSPARQPESNIVHVKGLTRPFTLLQLKELLSKYGKIIDSKFWIDSVKSHCLAAYETIEDAKLAREGLHRTKWPQSNPKVLRVEFATEEEFTFHVNGEKPKEVQNNKNISSNNSNKDSKVTNSSSSELKSEQLTTSSSTGDKSNSYRDRERDRDKDSNKPVREWDLPKLKRSRSRDISMERRRRAQDRVPEAKKEVEKEEPKEEEQPAKTLEDIFRKTNTTPHIYWLPLTDEEITSKELGRKQRMEERERRRAAENEAREKEEAERKLAVKVDDKENANDIQETTNGEVAVEKQVNGTSDKGREERGRDDRDRRYRDDRPPENGGRRRSPVRNDDRNTYRSARR